ncbi:MAG: hypothetical protein COU10_03625 [Candidatus Harrisonbacteria bacterium CG10_big_fil_rev_8_21_14_0_10_45_28]|uniref:Uncharacterized protein n=1 Tax=Candidatus Harrisonbacteria bacterium CG10_big_fil_rev_8_21_14_0_10_45_28 TaxID=1974586 RepID=A0A2H0UMI7_9BACT|nr:MAG: hypothetical protein COU10_03625 [Candidatus Harrisonbacteria bacterium CG10_big_fil_rev_8_21_14_0_10_45_28]
MKKTLSVLAIVVFVLAGQVPVGQAVVDNNIYSLGFSDGNGSGGVWRTMPDQVSFFLGCPNGYYDRFWESSYYMIDGSIDFGSQKVFYCWLPNLDELQYSTIAFGRALHGGLLPAEYLHGGTGGPLREKNSPSLETFRWNVEAWDGARGEFINRSVEVRGNYFDAHFSNKASAQPTIDSLSRAIAANGFGLSEKNQQDDGYLYLKGFAKKADKSDEFIACKITAKTIPITSGGRYVYVYSVRSSCGTYQ